jgi:hypothetical protein
MTETPTVPSRKRILLLLIPIALLAAAVAFFFLPRPEPKDWSSYTHECEELSYESDDLVVAQPNASGQKVLARFGVSKSADWKDNGDSVWYHNILTPRLNQVYLKLRYSKDSPASVPILVYIDYEPSPRAIFYPVDQHSWDKFAWTEPIPLGPVSSGEHFLRLATDGQDNGVADLDELILTSSPR